MASSTQDIDECNSSTLNMLTAEQRNALVFGYINQNITELAPKDIINLCLFFYDDSADWSFPDIEPLLNIKEWRQKIEGPIFTIRNITFQCMLHPKGTTVWSKGYMHFNIIIKSIPKNIKNVALFLQLHCKQIQYEFRSCSVRSGTGITKGWPTYTVKLEDIKQFKSLNLGYYVDILSIHYKDLNIKGMYRMHDKSDDGDIDEDDVDYITPVPTDYYQSITMNVAAEYKWVINDKLMDKFKTAAYGRGFYANSFNNECWCISTSPNGQRKSNEGVFILGLKLLKLPPYITGLSVEYEFCTSFGIKSKGNHRFTYGSCWSAWPNNILRISQLQSLSKMWINIKMRIVDVWMDFHTARTKIERNEWSSFGIVDKK